MLEKIILDDCEYSIEDFSSNGRTSLLALEFITGRIQELTNQHALLVRAKESYLSSLKKEMLADKAGFVLDDY
jgi:hypothetical protein